MLNHKTKGFTLIELLVVLIITSILLTSILAAYVSSLLAYQRGIKQAELDNSVEASMLLMSNDIQRAGYWKNASSDIGASANNNPFMQNDLSVNAANNCILFAYDKNGLGNLPTIGSGSDDERYGFRLMNNAIQMRPSGASYDCNAASSSWTDITDPTTVQISQLTFTVNNKVINIPAASGTPTLTIRTVTINITGNLTSDTAVTKSLSETVLVQNDKYTP